MRILPAGLWVLLAAAGAAAQEPGDYVLALSAQPAFCVEEASRPECASLDPAAPAVRLVALHGLWLQRRDIEYCNVPDDFAGPETRWSELEPVELDAALAAELAEVMPGVASHLDRHEWLKHGSCTHPTADLYFRESIDLVRQVWALPSIAALGAVQGSTLPRDALEALLAPDFGDDRLTVLCEDGALAELRLQLSRVGREPLLIPRDLRPGEIRFRDCPAEIRIEAPEPNSPG